MLLLALAHAMFMSLLLTGAGAIEIGAGSRQLERLGGLIHAMPITAGCMLAGAAALAALPPAAGFGGMWMLLQAVFAAPRAGGLGLQLLSAGVVAALALATALTAAASVRLVGVALLGRPRSPRASAASEAGACVRLAMLGLAGVSVLIGVFPGAVLSLAGPALRLLAGISMAERLGPLTVAAQLDAPGYVAPAIALLLGLAIAAALRGAKGGEHDAAGWDCGAEPAPPWLPFGDPLTQYGGASMAQPFRRALGAAAFRPIAGAGLSKFAWRLSVPTTRVALAAIVLIVVGRIGVRCGRGAVVTALLSLIAQLLHLALVLAAAPVVTGVLALFEARLQGRSGPHPLQPWLDLLRMFRKQTVMAESVSWLFRIAPAVAFGAIVVAAALVPSFALGMTFAPAADLLVIAGLLMLARCVLALAAMDTGTAFGGIGASRAMFSAVFAEPALLVVFLLCSLLAGSTNIDAVAAMLRDVGTIKDFARAGVAGAADGGSGG